MSAPTKHLADALAVVITIALPLLREATVGNTSDELVPLVSCGLDAKSARRAVRDGRLACARIGRRDFVKRSDVLRLFDELAAEQRAARAAKTEEKPNSYASVVQLERRRGAA